MKNNPKRQTPQGWPKDVPLPTQEEAEKSVREGEEKLRKNLEKIRKKSPPFSPEDGSRIIYVGF